MFKPGLVFALLTTLLSATAGLAQTVAYVRLEALGNQGSTNVGGFGVAHVEDEMHTFNVTGGQMAFRAEATAAPADLELAVFGSVSAWVGGSRVEGRSSWSDQFTINAPGLNGQRGRLTAHFQMLSAPIMIVGAGWSELSASSSVAIGTPSLVDAVTEGGSYYMNSWGGSSGTHPGFRVPISVDFIFGIPMTVSGRVSASCGVNENFICLNTLHAYWDGIESVSSLEIGAPPVPEFTALSSSTGFNYAVSAVPEATTALQLFAGICAMGGCVWRRGRSRLFR